MNNLTTTNDIHTFPHYWQFCCILHIDPTFLNMSNKNQYTMTFINQTIAKYMPTTNMSLKCHIYATCPNHLMYFHGGSMPICLPHKKSLWSKLRSAGKATERQTVCDCLSWTTKSAENCINYKCECRFLILFSFNCKVELCSKSQETINFSLSTSFCQLI